MKKFTDTIINSATGLPISGARVYVRDGSNNLATLYADDGSTPLVTEYAETNALGRFEFYVADGNYKLEYYFSGAVQVTVPDIEIISAENLPRSSATRDAMAALDGATVKATIVVESGHEGTWIWSNANLSAQVTADPTRLTYVAPASDPTGATGAWVKNSDTLDADLAASTGAALIGSTGGITVQASLNARPTSATLAASGGSALVGFLQSGTGAVARTAQAKMRDAISVKDYGALGDDTANDHAAITTAIAAAISLGKPLFFPSGTYKVTSSVSLPDYVTLIGEDPLRSIVRASATTFPVFVNTTTTTPRDVTIRNLQIKSGSYGIDITASTTQSNWQFEDVLFADSLTAGIRCNQMFILNSFTRVIFDSTNKGIICSAANANLNTFYDCEFKELANRSIDFVGGAEANTFTGCRFEARNVADTDTGNDVISVQASKALKFVGCYFEDTFINILRETSSTGTTEFDSCRFSGQEYLVGVDGYKSETFTSDGVVGFRNCQFNAGSNGAANMALSGANPGLETRYSNLWSKNSNGEVEILTKQFTIASGASKSLFRFTRLGTADSENYGSVKGELTVDWDGHSSGGTALALAHKRAITVRGLSNANMVLTLGTSTAEGEDAGGTPTLFEVGTATATQLDVGTTFTLASATIIGRAHLRARHGRATTYAALGISVLV